MTKHAFSTMILQLVSMIFGCENIYQITIDFLVVNLGFFLNIELLWNMSFHVHEICGSIDNLHPQKNGTLMFNDMFDSFVQDVFILVFHYYMFMRSVYSFELSCNTVLLKKLIELLKQMYFPTWFKHNVLMLRSFKFSTNDLNIFNTTNVSLLTFMKYIQLFLL